MLATTFKLELSELLTPSFFVLKIFILVDLRFGITCISAFIK